VAQQSDNFPDALYEIAWAYVRKGELQKAKDSTEVLLLVAENSVLAPEAKILQGTLLQKLQKYEEAVETYNQVINVYAPVRDEMDALLSVNKDPVRYFDELLARNEKSLDVTRLLPPMALKWASTGREVSEAMEITSALDQGQKGIEDSRAIADRILKSLEERGLESFPVLQEGFTRADAVETMLTRAEEGLTRVETTLTGSGFSAEQARALGELKEQAAALKQRIDTLPTTTEQLKERRERIQRQMDAMDKQAFQLGLDIQSQAAQLTAIRKYVDDTRGKRRNAAEDEKAFLEKVTLEQRGLDAMQSEVSELRSRLLDERTNADKAIGGEGQLRTEYAALLEEQQRLVGTVRGSAPADAQRVLLRADVVRADAAAVRERVGRSKTIIRERVARRAQKLKDQVIHEQQLIEGYASDTASVSGETRNLVGRIAFESFKRVRQSFYDLVLKADVGVVDVAFQRKQDKTSQIQKLAAQKDHDLKSLDDEFKEVLKDEN
jgi:tetratricopeptide (TPR) repeat protein